MTDLIVPINNCELNSKKINFNNALLLIATIVLLFIFGEIFFRIYYWALDRQVAANQNELCFKEMKNPKNYDSVSPNNFIYKTYWDEDPLIGLVPKKNFVEGQTIFLLPSGKKKLRPAVIYAVQNHNNQGLTNIEEFSLKKPKNKSIRIALFGDSFTCGSEVPLKFNVASLLKELIPNSEALNFCVLGSGIDKMYARYALESKQYMPDVVVFNVLADDLRRTSDCSLFRPNLVISDGHLVLEKREWQTLRDFYFNYLPPKFESYFIKHILFTYDEHTKFERAMKKGIEMFFVMIDELKIQTKEHGAALIIAPIIQENPTQLEIKTYEKMINILKEKKVNFLDSSTFFASQKKAYGNQSFYYTRAEDKFGHFSPIGNAVFAQGLKLIHEKAGIINATPNYYFANFKNLELIYFIPENFSMQMQGKVRAVSAFESEDLQDNSFGLFRDES